jgi:hypothetical protein
MKDINYHVISFRSDEFRVLNSKDLGLKIGPKGFQPFFMADSNLQNHST